MNSTYILIFLCNIIVSGCIHSIYNFIKPILMQSSEIKCKETSILDIFDILTFFIAYMWGFVSDKFNIKLILCSFCISGYCFISYIVAFHLKNLNADTFNYRLVLINGLLNGFYSGALPLITAISVSVCTNEKDDIFYLMRLALVLGRCGGFFLPLIIENIVPELPKNHFYSCLIFTLIGTPLLIFVHFKLKKVEKVVYKSNFKNIKSILISNYGVLLIYLFIIGISKTATINYQSIFTTEIFNHKITIYIFLFRAIPDLILTLFLKKIEFKIGCMGMIWIGGCLGFLKVVFYIFYPTSLDLKKLFGLFLVVECGKSVYCHFICYSMAKLNKFYNPIEKRGSAQTLFSAFFNSLPKLFSGIIGYFSLEDQISNNNLGGIKLFFKRTLVFDLIGIFIITYMLFLNEKIVVK